MLNLYPDVEDVPDVSSYGSSSNFVLLLKIINWKFNIYLIQIIYNYCENNKMNLFNLNPFYQQIKIKKNEMTNILYYNNKYKDWYYNKDIYTEILKYITINNISLLFIFLNKSTQKNYLKRIIPTILKKIILFNIDCLLIVHKNVFGSYHFFKILDKNNMVLFSFNNCEYFIIYYFLNVNHLKKKNNIIKILDKKIIKHKIILSNCIKYDINDSLFKKILNNINMKDTELKNVSLNNNNNNIDKPEWIGCEMKDAELDLVLKNQSLNNNNDNNKNYIIKNNNIKKYFNNNNNNNTLIQKIVTLKRKIKKKKKKQKILKNCITNYYISKNKNTLTQKYNFKRL